MNAIDHRHDARLLVLALGRLRNIVGVIDVTCLKADENAALLEKRELGLSQGRDEPLLRAITG